MGSRDRGDDRVRPAGLRLRRHRRPRRLHRPRRAAARPARRAREEPYQGAWALPGGFVRPRESAGHGGPPRTRRGDRPVGADRRALHLEQLRTYSEPDRDPRMRVVSVAYTALLPDLPEPRGGGDAAQAQWVPLARHRAARLRPRPDPRRRPRPGRRQARVHLPGHHLLPARVHPRRAAAGLRDGLGRRRWTGPTSGARSSPRPASSRPSGRRRAAPAAAGNRPRSTGRAPPPPCTRHCCDRKDGTHDPMRTTRTVTKQARHRLPDRTRPRGRAGLPDRVQRRAVDPRQVRPVAARWSCRRPRSSPTTPR